MRSLCVHFGVAIEERVVLDENQITSLHESHLYGLGETNNVSNNFFILPFTVGNSHDYLNLINY
jgi:hypothetical protein